MDRYSNNKTVKDLKYILDKLENNKLITEDERNTIETTGKVKIGSRTIVFDETETSNSPDWTKILEEANKNPENYIDPTQSDTNKDIGIGTDGKPVNMDLWNYIIEDNTIKLFTPSFGSGSLRIFL